MAAARSGREGERRGPTGNPRHGRTYPTRANGRMDGRRLDVRRLTKTGRRQAGLRSACRARAGSPRFRFGPSGDADCRAAIRSGANGKDRRQSATKQMSAGASNQIIKGATSRPAITRDALNMEVLSIERPRDRRKRLSEKKYGRRGETVARGAKIAWGPLPQRPPPMHALKQSYHI